MVFFLLFICFWLIVLAESIGFQVRIVKKAKKENKPFQFVLSPEQENVLSVLLGLRAFIAITQLFIGPLIDGLSITFTLLVVLGAEVFGMGFGGLVTITSIKLLVHTRRNASKDTNENSSIPLSNHQSIKGVKKRILFPIISGIVIGFLLSLLKGVLAQKNLLLVLSILMSAVFLVLLVDYLLSKKQ